jgi:amino acid adenylation domain-containing protein
VQSPARDVREAALTPTQRDLYLHSAVDPESTTYNIGMSVDLGRRLEPAVWERAVAHVVQEDDVTRTRIEVRDGEAFQRVDAACPCAFEFVELESLSPRPDSACDYLWGRLTRKIDLHGAPLITNHLVLDPAGHYTAAITLPHVLLDGVGMQAYFERIGCVYEALLSGREPPAPARPSFYDYAESPPAFDTPEAEAFWAKRLRHATPLELPAPLERRDENVLDNRALGAEFADEIRRHCAERNVRPSAFFITLYALLLQRYAQTDGDFVVHALLASRPDEHRGTLGCFYQVLPYLFPADLGDDETPVDRWMSHAAHYRSSLGSLQNVSVLLLNKLLRDQKLRCFYNYQSFAVLDLLGEQRTSEIYMSHPAEEVHLAVTDTGVSFELELYFNRSVFPGLRFLERLELLARQVCRGPGRAVDLEILLQGERPERARIRDEAPAALVHRRFEEQARLRPGASAVTWFDAAPRDDAEIDAGDSAATLSYDELNRRANRLAHHLLDLGVGADVPVALCLERSAHLVTAILAVVKAGGAYVPLDPANPDERLRFVLADTAAPVLLTEGSLAQRFDGSPCRIVALDAESEAIGRCSAVDPGVEIDPESLAYVIYTSGSTGRPKGVMVTHRNLARLFRATHDWFDFDERDVWTLFHSCAFDFSVWELWGALVHGARLVVVPGEVSRSPEAFHALLRREGVTVLNQTPSAFYGLIAVDETRRASSDLALRLVIFGGEALQFPRLAPWMARHGDRRPELVNMYGITETTVHVTYRRIAREDLEAGRGSLIGRPIPDLQVHVLDRRGRVLPPGFPGELCVGGAGVARGYLGRPELSGERFLADPFRGEPGARLYRSGDLARRLPDSDLEYLGRMDDQVKIRGFRVELGEIEARLAEHPSIRNAAVVAHADPSRHPGATPSVAPEQRLVAYLEARRDASTSFSRLREYLAARLPDYMLPASFVFLDRLPLTASGKIDRKRLPAPDVSRPDLDGRFAPARSESERGLAAIFAGVLGIDRVGIYDDFFELGGHSLAATQLVAQVRSDLGRELPLRHVFETPNVAALAARLEAEAGAAPASPRPALRPVGRDLPLPLSFAQERVWVLLQMHPHNRAYEFEATLRFRGQLDVEVLERVLGELVRRHEIYRTTFPVREERPVQVIHEPWPVRLTVVDLLDFPADQREREVRRRVRQAAEAPFQLDRLPLVRWTLLRLAPDEHLLIHSEHHLVHDGWSFVLFLRELLELYRAFAAGAPSPLAALPLQFADFAHWQRRWIEEHGERLEAFWRDALRGCPPLLPLPCDHPRPPVPRFRGDVVRLGYPADLCRELERLSRENGATPFMTLFTAFTALLHRYTGEEDIVVGSGIANRRWRETESLLGMIINNVALRTDLSGRPTLRELLRRVRDTALEAYEHQDLPFEKVVAAVNPPRSAAHPPLFQVAFTVYDGEMPDLELPGLSIQLEEGISTGTAKFDMNVIVVLRSRDEARGARTEPASVLWEYDSDLFERSTIERMTLHFRRMLEAMLADPDRPVDAIPLAPRDSSVPELFAAQVRSGSDRVALEFGGERLTYGELNARSNRLAHHLRGLGVGAETPVGVFLGRGVEMLVSLLGILKAGGAYVPLDPEYPSERLAFMLEDTGAPVVVTDSSLRGSLPEGSGVRLCVDTDAAAIASAPSEDPPCEATASSLAYVIYTSGSTGTPKGVAVEHGPCGAGVGVLVRRGDVRDLGCVAPRRVSGGDHAGGVAESGLAGVVSSGSRDHGAVPDDGAVQPGGLVGALGVRGAAVPAVRGAAGGPGAGASGAVVGSSGSPAARVRSDGVHDVRDVVRGGGCGAGVGDDPDRPSDCEHDGVRAGRVGRAGSGGGPRGAVPGGSRGGAGLLASSGADGGAFRCGRFRWRSGGPSVPDGRLGALPGGRGDRVSGSPGRPGEASGVPDRAGGDRVEAAGPRAGAGGGGAGAGGRARGQASGGVRGGGFGGAAVGLGAPPVPAGGSSGVHGALGVRGSGAFSAVAEREGGPSCAACAGGGAPGGGGVRGAAERSGASDRGDLARGAAAGGGGGPGQLLRPGGPLAASGAGAGSSGGGAGASGCGGGAVPAPDDRASGASPGRRGGVALAGGGGACAGVAAGLHVGGCDRDRGSVGPFSRCGGRGVVLGEPVRGGGVDHVLLGGGASGVGCGGVAAARPAVRAGARGAGGGGPVRPGLLRLRAAGGGADRPAAAGVSGVRVGGAGARGVRPGALRGVDRGVRGLEPEHVPVEPALASGPVGVGGEPGDDAGERG